MNRDTAMVTGASGFIGSRLVLALRAAGVPVVALGLENTPSERENVQALRAAGQTVLGVTLERPEGEAETAMLEALERVDVIYHLAAAQHEAEKGEEHFFDVNVAGTRYLLSKAREAGVRRVVYASSIGVYEGDGAVIDERSEPAPQNVYGRSKLEAERLVLAEQGRMSTSVIRISETYGPGDKRLLKLFQAIEKGVFRMIGPGRNRHHPIYIEDLIEALRLAAVHERAGGEAFIIAGPEAVTTGEMVAAVSRAVGRPLPGLRLPLWPFALAASAFEGVSRLTGLPALLHRRRLDFFRKSFEFRTDKARERLGFAPAVGLGEGMARTMEWYRDRGEIGQTEPRGEADLRSDAR